MRKFLSACSLFLVVLTLTACSLPRGAALSSEVLREQESENPSFSVVPITRANVASLSAWPATGAVRSHGWISSGRGPDSPLIRSGDQISLVIWDSQENSLLTGGGEKLVNMPGLVVSATGTIFVPYLDEVVVRGLTPADARRNIQDALVPIVPSAQVQLSIQAGKLNSVDIVSGVARPGSFPLPDRNYSILSLLAAGGGVSPTLRNPVVRLIREGKTYEIKAAELFKDGTKDTILRGNDKIVVQEDQRYFTALGATGTQELIYFEKETLTALETLSVIGGLAETRADLKGVVILREYPVSALRSDGTGPAMQQVVFTLDLTSADGLFAARNFQVNPLDTVLATESPVVSARTIFGILGSVIGVGNSLTN